MIYHRFIFGFMVLSLVVSASSAAVWISFEGRYAAIVIPLLILSTAVSAYGVRKTFVEMRQFAVASREGTAHLPFNPKALVARITVLGTLSLIALYAILRHFSGPTHL